MYYRKMWRAAVLLSGIVLLSGCEKTSEEEWVPRKPAAIAIDLDGKVTEYLSEELDQSYYSFDELSSMLTSEAASYNSEHGGSCVEVTKAEQNGKKAELVITYASGEDYARFNNVEFYYGSMIHAQMAGYLFDGSFQKVRDGVVQGSEVSGSEVLKNMADMVVVVQAPLEVHVPGEVSFTSTNGTVFSGDTVYAEESSEEEGLVLPSDQVYYASGDPDAEAADRVYIIFDDQE